MQNSPFLSHPAGQCATQDLLGSGSWPAAKHVWAEQELDALALAQASGRPLLIRGEPGIGKSQIARAASALLNWTFAYEVITARHEAEDLLWHYDAVERLALAHKAERTQMQDFVRPGILWRALNPQGAAEQQAIWQKMAAGAVSTPREEAATLATTHTPAAGTVVLLDEIDKADSDLPNSLLEVLANGGFALPWGGDLYKGGSGPAPCLIILTSNEERELPTAFVRRCICLHLLPPQEHQKTAFVDWLLPRARVHFPAMADSVLQQAAKLVYDDRQAAPAGMGARPGLAEYLDLLRALDKIEPLDAALQGEWLARLAPYVLLKQYPQSQQRGLATPDPRIKAD